MGYHDSTGRWRELRDSFGLTAAQLKLLDVASNTQGERVQLSNGNMYYYHATSVLSGDDLFVIAPAAGPGRYLLAPGYAFDLAIAISKDTANAAVLATAPANMAALLGRSYWEITANWTGGSSSAIGIDTDTAPHNTAGDLLGGAGGDVAATLVAAGGKLLGTVGTDVAAGILLKGGVEIQFNRITSAFTAGTGYVHVVGTMQANPGA